MKNILVIIMSLTFAFSALACSEDGSTGFVPENDMFLPVGIKSNGGISEEQFNAVIDKLEVIYSPVVSSMGGKLKINRKWDNGTVNANATRTGGWIVNMYGGLARHETITPDGFALVLCHEIGHHLGGAPKVGMILNRWASNEGQSDYFATLKCLRSAFLNDDNAKVLKSFKSIPTHLTKSCNEAWNNKLDREICIRNGMAGMSVAGLFAALRKQPEGKFETPDQNVVSKTDHSHPAHQCRLDTYFQGALCEMTLNDMVSQKDETSGTCNTATGHKVGVRPLCWFKPKN